MLVLQYRGESCMSFAASILSWLESYCPCGASRLELSGHKPSKAPSTGDVAAWACVEQDQSREAMVVIQETREGVGLDTNGQVTERRWKLACGVWERKGGRVILEVTSWDSWPWCGTGTVGACVGSWASSYSPGDS